MAQITAERLVEYLARARHGEGPRRTSNGRRGNHAEWVRPGRERGRVEFCVNSVKEMWETFLRQGGTHLGQVRKVPVEWRVAYYAGCHKMPAKMLAMPRR